MAKIVRPFCSLYVISRPYLTLGFWPSDLTQLGDSLDNPEARDRVRYAYDNGFQVGSHTWAHLDLATLDYGGSEFSRGIRYSQNSLNLSIVNSEMERTEGE